MIKDYIGIILWSLGILLILFSIHLLSLLKIKFGDYRFKKLVYSAMILIFVFIIFRAILRIYSNNLSGSGLAQEIITEELLFYGIFLNIPFAIAATIILFICYNYLMEFRFKSK